MKIGILSMQRIINYGSFLQAYSLKKNIEKLGHEVEFVDYKAEPALVQNTEKSRSENRIIHKLKKCKDQMFFPYRVSDKVLNENLSKMYDMEGKYYTDYFKILGLTKEKNITPKLDALVIGSDEVFNCVQANPEVGYSRQLFGKDYQADKLISYAASFGNTTLKEIEAYGIKDEIADMLSQFDAISVRDKNSISVIQELVKSEPEYHVDPVFLYDYEPHMPKKKQTEQGYIVIYSYACRIKKEEAAQIKKFAQKVKKPVICLSGPQFYFKNYRAYAPFEMLEFIKNADYVITDTFHGSVFSIKYNRNFAVYTRGGHGADYGNSEKLRDLLARFGLQEREVTKERSLAEILENMPDYAPVNAKIEREREKSQNYLKKMLQK